MVPTYVSLLPAVGRYGCHAESRPSPHPQIYTSVDEQVWGDFSGGLTHRVHACLFSCRNVQILQAPGGPDAPFRLKLLDAQLPHHLMGAGLAGRTAAVKGAAVAVEATQVDTQEEDVENAGVSQGRGGKAALKATQKRQKSVKA